jgi:hypothetical protein
MGAFSIAFDTIIVGSLALTWVLLVIHLFFSDNELRIGKILDWVGKQNQPHTEIGLAEPLSLSARTPIPV